MDKVKYVQKLYDDLKDNLEFDEDIRSLFTTLVYMLKEDSNRAVDSWIYVLKKYSLKEIKRDIDVTPLTSEFIGDLLKDKDLDYVFGLLSMFSLDNQDVVWQDFFNTISVDSKLFQYFRILIEKENFGKETQEIKLIIKKSRGFSKLYYHNMPLLKNIILIHMELGKMDMPTLLSIANIPKSRKEQAILKTLFIDYI